MYQTKKVLIISVIAILSMVVAVWASTPVTTEHNVTTLGFSTEYLIWALVLGGLSAVSLPLGSLLGVMWKPKPIVTGALAAFGAGALLAALSVELVAPTMLEITHSNAASTGSPSTHPIALILGCIGGGLLFVILDQLLNLKGGYLRKTATAINYLSKDKKARVRRLLECIGKIEIFRTISTNHVQLLVDYFRPEIFKSGEILFHEGDPGDLMYFVEEGEIQLLRGAKELQIIGPGNVIGEISVITGSPRTADAVAITDISLMRITKSDFQQIRKISPEFEAATKQLASHRLEELSEYDVNTTQSASSWAIDAAKALQHGTELPTTGELRKKASQHNSAPLAIWLGILLDGIPESFVIGTSFLIMLTAKSISGTAQFSEVIPYTLIAGLFLSNFPEAMSSSIGMRAQGWKISKILMMWTSLMVLTCIGAGIGYSIGADVSPTLVVMMEGLAAGAMLTMIAQTMIPEAIHLGGPTVVGLSTLSGFLGAIAFKLLEI